MRIVAKLASAALAALLVALLTGNPWFAVAVITLAMAGIVDAPTLLRGTPYAVLGVFITAAILTPPDWVSQIFLAVPMVVLYLLGVGVAWLFGGNRSRGGG